MRRAKGDRTVQRAKSRAAAARANDGPDAVRCLLCKKRFRSISATHLWACHGYESEHPVDDYKERFGLRVAASHATCRRCRSTRVATLKRLGQFWPRARVLDELRRRARSKRSLGPSQLPSTLQQAILRRFGSWEKAVRRAGLSPIGHRFHGRWDEDSVVAEIRRLARAGARMSDKRAKERHRAFHAAACRIVGSWSAAVRLAGLDSLEHRERKKWTVDAARSWTRTRHKAGKSIRAQDGPLAMVRVVRRETGLTWARYVESIGIRYPGGHKRYDWTDAGVLAEIRERQRRKLPLNLDATRRDGQALTHQAMSRFGSWDAALRAAGIAPESVRRHRMWSRQDVLTAVRARHAARRPMRRTAAYADEPRLVKAAQRLFPFSWSRALAAAGLDPSLARRKR